MKNLFYLFLLPLFFTMGACSSDDSNDSNSGSNNASQPSEVKEVGVCYASFEVKITVSEELKVGLSSMGVQCATDPKFEAPLEFSTNEFTGNTFKVDATGLKPGTKYYFRTFEELVSRSYGATKSFKTRELKASQITVSGGEPWIRSYSSYGDKCYRLQFKETTVTIKGKMNKKDFSGQYDAFHEVNFPDNYCGYAIFKDNKYKNNAITEVPQKDMNSVVKYANCNVIGEKELTISNSETSFSFVYEYLESGFEYNSYNIGDYVESFEVADVYYRPYIRLGGQMYLIGNSTKLSDKLNQ